MYLWQSKISVCYWFLISFHVIRELTLYELLGLVLLLILENFPWVLLKTEYSAHVGLLHMKQQRLKSRGFFFKQKDNRNRNKNYIKFQKKCLERKRKIISDLKEFPGKISMNLGYNHVFWWYYMFLLSRVIGCRYGGDSYSSI